MTWAPRIVAEDDQVVLAEPVSDPASPVAEEMTWAPRIVAEDDQVVLAEPVSDPAGVAAAAGSAAQTAPAAQAQLGEPGRALRDRDLGSAAAQAPIAGGADAGNSSTALATSTEPGPASPSAVDAGGTRLDARWREIQAAFVDDPRSSVELAADLTGDRAEALVLSVRERQQSLLSAWQGDDAGTEQLRIVLQQYRKFCGQLEDLVHGD